ncbi:MAG: discoidin domain-containing protein [Armatimonadetes bacterium]|nr:discoidin domain-containing protein [Armatimonadota bacterium]
MPFNQAAWAAAETDQEHWVEIQWPTPKTVGRVLIYWNIENDVVWTSQRAAVQVRAAKESQWQTVADVQPSEGEPVTEIRFPAVPAQALRILQPRDCGPRKRPRLMWLREVAVYAQ